MADKRPTEEQNEGEKEISKKEEESNADRLKKGIAASVTQFLSTDAGKNALKRGKDFFVKQFLSSRETSEADTLVAYKELIGKKGADMLEMKDLADISIEYDRTFETYIEGEAKAQFLANQEKAIAHAFLEKMNKQISGKSFGEPQRNAWNQYVYEKRDSVNSRGDIQFLMKEFFAKAGLILTAEQKKELNKVSIELRDVANYMTEESGFEKAVADSLNKKEIISANTDVEDMVKRFLRLYAQTEVVPAYERYQDSMKDIESIYKVPGFQRVLADHDLSIQNLIKNNKSFRDVYNNPSASGEAKMIAQQNAIVESIRQKDTSLAELMENLFANEFNLARIPQKQQQFYLDRFQEARSESKEMKVFDDIFTKAGVDVSDRKDLMKQIFDLSKNELSIKGKDGKSYNISLQKKIIDRPRSAETMSEKLAHELPVAFLITENKSVDEEYLQVLTKVKEKSFALKDKDGNDVQLFPGHYVELTTKDGKQYVGYVYQDPERNIMLSSQPGSADKIIIKNEDVNNSTVRIVEPTYVLKTEELPVLISHIALMRETGERDEEKNQQSTEERTNDIAEQILKEDFKKPEENPTDVEIESMKGYDTGVIASLDEEKKKELQDYIAHRTREMDARVKKIDNQIKNNDKAIQKVRDELNVALNQIPLDKKQVQRLNNKLLQLEKQKDDLREEKESLANKMHDFLDVQKKILEARAHNPLQDSIFNAPEFIDKEKDFLHRWADLKGDTTITEPIAGKNSLMILLPDAISATSGGGGAWVRGDIIGYDPQTFTMQIKWHGVEAPLKNIEGSVSTINGESGLQELQRSVSKIYKLKKYHSIADRGMDLKGGVTSSDNENKGVPTDFHFDKKYEGWRKHIKDDINFSSMKQQGTGDSIKYFGKKTDGGRVRYEVEPLGESINVREITIEVDKEDKKNRSLKSNYSKKMSANDFMMFAMEKDLRGYTQEEVDKSNDGKVPKGEPYIADRIDVQEQGAVRYGKSLFGRKPGNIAGIISSWDIVKKGIKNYFDERSKKGKSVVENAMLGSSWFKALEKMPILGGAFEDIRGGFESKQDSEKKKKINEFKDEVEQKKGPHSSGASDFIKASLTDSEAHTTPLKAAGYYLYALQEGSNNPYFRSLKEFDGTGFRVKKILGDKYVDQYKSYIEGAKAESKKDPNNQELKTIVYKGELGFLQKVWKEDEAQLKPLFGSRFFTGGLGAAYNNWYSGAGINKTYEGEDKPKGFVELYEDSWPGLFENNRINDAIAYMKFLSEKVGPSENNYYKWAGFMLMPLMNGQYREHMSAGYQGQIASIAKKAAFPFAGYMTEGNGTEKMQQLFDLVTDGSLTKAFEEEPKTDKGQNLSDIAVRTKAFKKRWESKGRDAINQLQDPKQLFLIKQALEKNLGNQDNVNAYNTLVEYINAKYNDKDRSNLGDSYGGDSILYQKNIFSAPSGLVKENMLNFSNGQFKGKSEKNGPELWNALKAKLSDIQNIQKGEMSLDFFVFLLKRYFAMFQSKYNGVQKKLFVSALKFSDIPNMIRLNVRGVFDKKLSGDDLPAEVQDTLIVFERIFQTHAGLIKKNPHVLEDIFEDPSMVEHYENVTQEAATKVESDNRKRMLSDIQRFELLESADDEDYFNPWAA